MTFLPGHKPRGPALANANKTMCCKCDPPHPYTHVTVGLNGHSYRYCLTWKNELRRRRKYEKEHPGPERDLGALCWIYGNGR